MKKIIAMSISVLLVLSLFGSLVGCTGDVSADAEEPTTVFVRMDTVPEENVVSYINAVLENSNATATKINVEQGFSANDAKAYTLDDYAAFLNGEEIAADNAALNTLDDTLGFIKTYLMSGFSAATPEITALPSIDNADVVAVVDYNDKTARNWTSENVTNEEGESIAYEENVPKYEFDMDGNEMLDQPVTDEDGSQVYYENGDIMAKSYVCDNKMKATLSFYAKDEEAAAPVFADSAIIEKYFPNTIDKEYVLTELAKVNTAVAISDYSVEYTDCNVYFEIDMETEQVLSARFTKNAFVTFDAAGAGSFADLGEFKITFNFTTTVTCNFDYTIPEEEVEETAVDAAISDGDVITNGDAITGGDVLTDGDVDEVEPADVATVPEIAIQESEAAAA